MSMATMSVNPAFLKRLRSCALLVIIASAIEVVSLLWLHPLAFILFSTVGAAAVLLAVGIYLHSLVSMPIEAEKS